MNLQSLKIDLRITFLSFAFIFHVRQVVHGAGLPEDVNPCAYTLCIVNTTCITVQDPEACTYPPPSPTEEPCRKKAMCVPTGPNYGGAPNMPDMNCVMAGKVCRPDQKCEFVQYQCITTPCPSFYTCVDNGR